MFDNFIDKECVAGRLENCRILFFMITINYKQNSVHN